MIWPNVAVWDSKPQSTVQHALFFFLSHSSKFVNWWISPNPLCDDPSIHLLSSLCPALRVARSLPVKDFYWKNIYCQFDKGKASRQVSSISVPTLNPKAAAEDIKLSTSCACVSVTLCIAISFAQSRTSTYRVLPSCSSCLIPCSWAPLRHLKRHHPSGPLSPEAPPRIGSIWLRNQKSSILHVWRSLLLLAGSRWENMSASFVFQMNIWAFTLARVACCFWLFSRTRRPDWLSLFHCYGRVFVFFFFLFWLLAVINPPAAGSQGGLRLNIAVVLQRRWAECWEKPSTSKSCVLVEVGNCLTFNDTF